MPTPRTEFWAGVRAELPLLVGVVPFGMIYGVLALSAGIPAGLSQAMSSVVFAGSAQFVATQLIASRAPLFSIVLTGVIVNLRHALYSASVAPFLHRLPARWKLLLGYLLTDEAYAVAIIHYLEDPADSNHSTENDHKHWYFLGSGIALWSSWQLSTAAGIFLGAQIPASWSLDFTLALTFIALLVPTLRHRAGVVAALAGGITAVLAVDLPLRLGLVISALVGILAGLWSEQIKANR